MALNVVRSSRKKNLGGYDPFWYITMSTGDGFPMEPSLVGAEGSDRVTESGSEVGSLIDFSLGGPGSGVGSTEGGWLEDSRGSSSSLSKSSRKINGGITISLLSELLYSVPVITALWGWWVPPPPPLLRRSNCWVGVDPVKFVKIPQTCCRTWLVPPDPDLWTSLG